MAHEFCEVCKPNTRKKCSSCPRAKKPLAVVATSKMAVEHYPTLSFMGTTYYHEDGVERLRAELKRFHDDLK